MLKEWKCPWIRLFIGHDHLASSLLSSALQKLDSCDISLKIDPIQAPSTTICGWLLGTHRSFDLTHYAELLNSSPKFASNPVSLSSRVLKLFYQETIRKGQEVWAVHVLCDASKRTSTNVLLKAQYNRRRASDLSSLPEGKVFKYITYSANRDDLMPNPTTHNKLKRLRIRQQ